MESLSFRRGKGKRNRLIFKIMEDGVKSNTAIKNIFFLQYFSKLVF